MPTIEERALALVNEAVCSPDWLRSVFTIRKFFGAFGYSSLFGLSVAWLGIFGGIADAD